MVVVQGLAQAVITARARTWLYVAAYNYTGMLAKHTGCGELLSSSLLLAMP
jgi:hypothetical protein